MKKFVLGLFLILLVSGCTIPDLGGIIPGLGGGKNVNTTVMSPDVIVIKNINVIPSSPINAGDQFSVSFELVNQDEIKYVKTSYVLFDTGLCAKQTTGDLGEKPPWNMVPSGTEFVQWDFKAPENEEIAYLPNKCPIRFNVNYTFNATTQIDVDVISKTRLAELQKAGTNPTFMSSLNIGRGPVKIQLSFGTSLPVRDESALPIFITVEDVGAGLLGVVPASALKIYVPSVFTIPEGDRFDCSDSVTRGGTSYRACHNKEDIPIIRKKSSQMRIGAKSPTSSNIGNMEKTFFITAELEYSYEITGETSVSVKPTIGVGGTSCPTCTTV